MATSVSSNSYKGIYFLYLNKFREQKWELELQVDIRSVSVHWLVHLKQKHAVVLRQNSPKRIKWSIFKFYIRLLTHLEKKLNGR